MKVYSSPNLTMVGHMKNVLDAHDIACDIRVEFRGGRLARLKVGSVSSDRELLADGCEVDHVELE